MAIFYHVIALLGGLAMFLYGMRVMGDGLKANSGGTMKRVLEKVTNKPILGFLLGMVVTCIIQSSTATIVLTVGLVGAEFLTFRQSIGVVLGANVGTAITAQIIRLMDVGSSENSLMYFFKADNLAPMALIIGIIILMTTKRESKKNIGNVACGFGVLFMGLIFMSEAVAVFEDSLSGLLTAFENNYPLGFLSGVLVTGVIQSSSAVVGIVQSVASTMGVTFKGVFAVIMGVNIGDCLTTFLVSRIGAKPKQVRTAVVHVVYNVCAVILLVVLLTIGRLTGILGDGLWYAELNSGGVANVHGLFRVIPAILLLPFCGVMAKITEKIVPDKPENEASEEAVSETQLKGLDDHLLTSPILALDQVGNIINAMGAIAMDNFVSCRAQAMEYAKENMPEIREREDLLDYLTDATSKYLVKMTPYIKRDRDFRRQNFDLKASVCLERIGDACMDICDATRNMAENDKAFSKAARAEMNVVFDAVDDILNLTLKALQSEDDDVAKLIEPLEEVIDDLSVDLNNRHAERTSQNKCDMYAGIQFQNILTNLEKISDQCSAIAVYMTAMKKQDVLGHEHQYISDMHHSVNSEFQRNYREDKQKYFTRLVEIPVLETE